MEIKIGIPTEGDTPKMVTLTEGESERMGLVFYSFNENYANKLENKISKIDFQTEKSIIIFPFIDENVEMLI